MNLPSLSDAGTAHGRRCFKAALVAVTALTFMTLAGYRGAAFAQTLLPQGAGMPPSGVPGAASLNVHVLEQAAPDECFFGIGSPLNQFPANSCPAGMPKVNQSYVWGLAQSGDTLWYGTAANPLCEVLAALFTAAGITPPAFETPSYVCEFSQSNFLVSHPEVPPALGDWRPPVIHTFDLATGTLANKTPNDPRIQQTLGLRSAVATKKVIILGGPVLAPLGAPPGGINLFAFNAKTGAYLGSTTLPQYSDIRIWTQLKNGFYAGVQKSNGTGAILRYRGNVKHPFEFQVVGNLDNEASYIIAHGGRLYATTWRDVSSPSSPMSGLWVSPKAGAGGLGPNVANRWTKIFNVSQYEPDPVTASLTLGGAVGEEGPYLYFGTMSVPISAALAHFRTFPSTFSSLTDIIATIINSQRAIAIFRCCKAGPKGSLSPVELLYGDSVMPVYDPTSGNWQTVSNNMNVEPTFGPAGFGNPFNTYTWAMASFQGSLYVGTFDWSFLVADSLDALLTALGLNGSDIITTITQLQQAFNPGLITFGADLWRFPNANSPAVVESQFGVGNFLNYGIRTMISSPSELFAGSANPMNLRTDPSNPPLGGFELLGLTP